MWRFSTSILAGVILAAAPPSWAQEPSDPPVPMSPAEPVSPAAEPALAGPLCKASSAILVDAATGTVLWEKNSRVRRPMASTTKIMTASLLLEHARLEDRVTFSEHARQTPYANLNAKPGEQIRMSDLLYAIMLRSSNDGCVAAAEHVSGAAWKFAYLMTARAQQIGATDTRFVTVNGLYHPQHYSTAYDLSLMTRYAIQNPQFNQIVGTKARTISRSINQKDLLIRNHNKFLSKYQGADGVKTGYVRQSGRCLVSSSTRPEQGMPWRLIAVVLNSRDTYGDSARMMDWGRRNFQPIFFARQGEAVTLASVRDGSHSAVPLLAAQDLLAIVRREPGRKTEREIRVTEGLPAPIHQAQVGGTLLAVVNGKAVAQVDLLAARPISRVWTASVAPVTGWSMGFAALLLVPRYARKIAKSSRRRRRRLAARRGELDFGRQS